MMILLILVIALVLYYGFKNSDNLSNTNNDPVEMLKARFVNGEIDEQTYLEMKETIKK